MDGINLWLAALRNSPSPFSCNHSLLEKLISMLSVSFDILGSITDLLVSYFVLDATSILRVRITVAVFGAAD